MERILLVAVFLLSIQVAAAQASAAEEAKKVPLKTTIPAEVLAGTPPDVLAMLYPNLEKPDKKALAKLLVPAGTVNLALNKKVTSSESDPILGKLPMVTDGKKEGREDTYVELSPQLQWVQIDLGRECRIYAILCWHYFQEARSYNDVVVRSANDPEFRKEVHTIYNNDQDNSARCGVGKDRPYIETNLGKLIDAKGVSGRYVRLYSNGNTANNMNHYIEVEVFGKPAPSRRGDSR